MSESEEKTEDTPAKMRCWQVAIRVALHSFAALFEIFLYAIAELVTIGLIVGDAFTMTWRKFKRDRGNGKDLPNADS